MEQYFTFLNSLRESGATNMFGAARYLQEEFPELEHDHQRAGEILQAWMDSFRNDCDDNG